MFVAHPLVRSGLVRRRDYQVAIAAECAKRNTLVILPTGLGKTVVALLVLAERVRASPGKVLFLAPTKPLVEQHAAFLRATFAGGAVEVLTGESGPDERELLWKTAAVLCATPQSIRNDLVSGRLDLTGTTLVVFDEAHRATGNYAYGFIAEQFRRQRLDGRILGMTASPGANAAKIREVCDALTIEGVEIRTEDDPDTRPYLQDVGFERVEVAMPESARVASEHLKAILGERIELLRRVGAVTGRYVSKRELLAAQARLRSALDDARARGVEPERALWDALSAQAAALKVQHALELVETQGIFAFEAYCERLAGDESKAARVLVADARFALARRAVEASRVEHPKMRKAFLLVKEQLKRKPDSKIILFTNYRDVADVVAKSLGEADPALRPIRFVGQGSRAGDKGLTQKEQVDLLDRFRGGEYNVLVATSVAEEGLDIPATDLVVFYEPVASEIRAIQRRGRTGRNSPGRVVVLVTKGTSDEALLWASRGKEKRMRREMETLKAHFSKVNASLDDEAWRGAFTEIEARALRPATERPLEAFGGEAAPPKRAKAASCEVVVDHREFAGHVARELARLDVAVRPASLDSADYVLSDRVAVERKTSEDYEESLMDGRLFAQVKAMRDAYASPILLVEGGIVPRRLSAEAVWGSVAALAAGFRVPVLSTRDAAETARVLAAIARREQDEEKRPVAVRQGKHAPTDDERLRFLAEGLPDVSAVLARRLLDRFGTIRALANATEAELMEVDGIGKARAGEIIRILTARWRGA